VEARDHSRVAVRLDLRQRGAPARPGDVGVGHIAGRDGDHVRRAAAADARVIGEGVQFRFIAAGEHVLGVGDLLRGESAAGGDHVDGAVEGGHGYVLSLVYLHSSRTSSQVVYSRTTLFRTTVQVLGSSAVPTWQSRRRPRTYRRNLHA